jgi:succinate-semialdehyde dehydrogenase/glutarate-semialdehyde dehydrogenase
MLIDGQWVKAANMDEIEVINPATEETIGFVPKAAKSDVESAIHAASNAFKSWASQSPAQRGSYLRRASSLVLDRSKEIAALMTREQGKPLHESEGEIIKGAEILQYYAEEGERIYGRIVANSDSKMESQVIYQPVGPAAAISPWNYPVELLAWKIGGALSAGCSIVAKLPSETPFSPLEFIKCLVEAGIPNGVLNGVTGPGSILGPILAKSSLIKKIAFTGSTEVGKQVLLNSIDTLKRISLELGGSLPMVVCEDCNIDAAVEGAVRRSFRNMGQICIAINRIYVDKTIYEPFISKFAEAAKKLTIGNGIMGKFDLGPMCTKNGLDKAVLHVKDALSKGAGLCCGGKPPEGNQYERGYFYEPTVLRDVNHSMLVMKEETFGPVVGVMPFQSLDEAINLANDTPYGLAAIIYTESLNTANRFIKCVDSGNIAVNNVDAGVINAPYGGWKDSGFGHEHGPEGLYEYLNIKHVRIRYA